MLSAARRRRHLYALQQRRSYLVAAQIAPVKYPVNRLRAGNITYFQSREQLTGALWARSEVTSQMGIQTWTPGRLL